MKRYFLRTCLILGLVLTASVFCDENELEDDDDGVTVESEDTDDILEYKSPVPEPGKFYFAEHFDDKDQFDRKWIKSRAKKDGIDEEIAKYDGIWALEEPIKSILREDLGLVLKSKAKHAAISSRLTKPFVFSDKPLVVQYEVTWQDGQECGGSYIKLLSSGKDTTDLAQVMIFFLTNDDETFNPISFLFLVPRQNTIHNYVWTRQVWQRRKITFYFPSH